MLSLLHSYYKTICLALVLLLGLACGHLADSLLQSKLRPDIGAGEPTRSTAVSSSPGFSVTDLDQVLQQNLFAAGQRSLTAAMGLSAASTAETKEAASLPTDLKLIGTVVAGAESMALVEINRKLEIFHLNQDVPGGRIESIERNQVTIRTDNQRLVTLQLHEKGISADLSSAPAKSSSEGDTLTGTIREVGDNRWLVSSDMVESIRENFSSQLRLAQLSPRLVDGKTDGFLVRNISRRSILSKMGLKRGDVVINVNNIMLDSPEKALQIFQQLREARRLTVAVERDGKPLSFVYEIE